MSERARLSDAITAKGKDLESQLAAQQALEQELTAQRNAEAQARQQLADITAQKQELERLVSVRLCVEL